MEKQVSFFGFKFTNLKFIIFFFCWMFFLGFVWPLIIGSYLFMSIFVCGFSVIFAGLFNRLMGLLILALLFIHESLIRIYQNFMLVLTAIFATLIYSIWIPMNFWIYMAHLVINIFSIFLMYMMFYKKDSQNVLDEVIIFDDEDNN
ncbi:hypothetical protein [Flavobacterium pectinovorum]|uniref:Uncharacterized protein n=1 Tax=Flavobacterium pectinovorum TaxID=29533 RepID=A0A502ETV8_9FLAO|nr:hypothetical protein [Flavobacterium pectinovorum]TPG39980.1 hypothetical protein EAH81_11815 [Flavobacterium pectinovorum]